MGLVRLFTLVLLRIAYPGFYINHVCLSWIFGNERLQLKPFTSFCISSHSFPVCRGLFSKFWLVFCPDVYFITTVSFLWKVTAITLVSCLPLYILKYLRRRFSPPSYSKLTS